MNDWKEGYPKLPAEYDIVGIKTERKNFWGGGAPRRLVKISVKSRVAFLGEAFQSAKPVFARVHLSSKHSYVRFHHYQSHHHPFRAPNDETGPAGSPEICSWPAIRAPSRTGLYHIRNMHIPASPAVIIPRRAVTDQPLSSLRLTGSSRGGAGVPFTLGYLELLLLLLLLLSLH